MCQNIIDKEWDILYMIEILNQLGFFILCDVRKLCDCDIVLEMFFGFQSDWVFYLIQVGLIFNKGLVSKCKYIFCKLFNFKLIVYCMNIFLVFEKKLYNYIGYCIYVEYYFQICFFFMMKV